VRFSGTEVRPKILRWRSAPDVDSGASLDAHPGAGRTGKFELAGPRD
jgi:hypothetical protein